MEITEATEAIQQEYYRATLTYPDKFKSFHEGYAVILEELDELWDEIKLKNPDKTRLKQEAIQIGAMATRFLVELL